MTMTIERHETKASRPMSERIAALERMTASQLRREYAEVFGEESRSGNRQWLFRRIAWRIQFDAGGSFAQRADEKARARLRRHRVLQARPLRRRPATESVRCQLSWPSETR